MTRLDKVKEEPTDYNDVQVQVKNEYILNPHKEFAQAVISPNPDRDISCCSEVAISATKIEPISLEQVEHFGKDNFFRNMM